MDRLLALLLGLRYRQVVTLRRAYGSVIAFWAVSIVYSAIRLFISLSIRSWYENTVISLCLVTLTFSHTKIVINLRHRQNQVQVRQPNQTNQLNMARYRKAVSTALWLQFTSVACYLPFVVLVILHVRAKPSLNICFSCSELYIHFSFLKLNNEPDSLLLENRRS